MNKMKLMLLMLAYEQLTKSLDDLDINYNGDNAIKVLEAWRQFKELSKT